MRYFLTGATGFIGGRLAVRLRRDGHEVVALVRSPEKAGPLAEIGATLVRGDVTSSDGLAAAMAGCDGVFHVAGWYKVGGRHDDTGVRVNIDGTRNVLTAMRVAKVPRGVYTSTLAVHSDTGGRLVDEDYRFRGEHLSEYDRTKAEAHLVADSFIGGGLPLVIVQPGLVYGPGDTSAAHDTLVQFVNGTLPLVPERTAYCWGHIDDTVDGHVRAMESGRTGQSYHICGPAHSLVDALEIAARITGIPAPRRRASPGTLRAMARAAALVERFARVPDAYSSEMLRVLAGVTYTGDNSRAKQELGFAPRSLEEGLRETLRWELERLGRAPGF